LEVPLLVFSYEKASGIPRLDGEPFTGQETKVAFKALQALNRICPA
jgi:hypothetical protein